MLTDKNFSFLISHHPDSGLRGCYQGLTATMMKQGSNQAIRFFVIETLKDWYRGDDKQKKVPTLITGVFGAIAGTASVYGNTPIDVVKTRMQVGGREDNDSVLGRTIACVSYRRVMGSNCWVVLPLLQFYRI